ncbi:hypothetical protein DsansV1_C14g0131641 [Dioscorea sansibarensis]
MMLPDKHIGKMKSQVLQPKGRTFGAVHGPMQILMGAHTGALIAGSGTSFFIHHHQ